MGLTYHFSIVAKATETRSALKAFLEIVEAKAQKMGFSPTLILDAQFSTPAQLEFARRLTTGYHVQNERLKTARKLDKKQIWTHSPTEGFCRLAPLSAVVLIVTDEHGCETIFGFLKFPDVINDSDGHFLMDTGVNGRWLFRDFVKSADSRFRSIIREFHNGGYLEGELDEFQQTC